MHTPRAATGSRSSSPSNRVAIAVVTFVQDRRGSNTPRAASGVV